PRLIGDMLVEAGIITIEHRNLILKAQKRLIKEIKHSYDNTDTRSANNKFVKKKADTADQKQSAKISKVEIIEYGIKLEIKHDNLTALIFKTEDFDNNVNPDDIRDLLIKKGIVFGIVSDDLFLGFIKSSGFKKKGFIAAKGTKPIKGENAKVEYLFDTDHLKAGGLSSSGRIDFKDRGIIPQVEKGTVLAEKTPLKESFSGKTVFNVELTTKKAQDIKLRYGQGVKLSEDGLKTIASVNGYPKLTWAGLVVVNKEYATTGDVNYKTGHIKYDGNIKIKGCIKDGFKVKGNDIMAREIEGGIIHAEGDLNITNGINEAKIYAKGNVYAKFVHNSNIVCMGNIYIAKEIVDSKIDTSGACITKDGKIISCKITAKMGVFAKQVGTELSEPNIIKTGHDAFVSKELSNIKGKISTLTKEKNKKENKKEKLIDENKKHHKAATHLANLQEKSRTNLIKISTKLDSVMEKNGKKEESAKLETTFSTLKNEDKKIDKKLTSCFDKIDAMEKQLKGAEESFSTIKQNIDDLRQERQHLLDWNKTNLGDTTIHVTGVVFPGTIVQGKYSEKQIKDKLINAKIKELMYQSDDDKRGRQYEMIIT
ncbi:MAG: DUF342 domain-containing protein, partial [Desulfobacteraceae bacterium]|nr:DUF342 domain-containing protein [Desulfobacteraceae bacterium]